MTTQENIHTDQDAPFDGIKEKKGQKPPVYFNVLYYGLILWAVIFMAYYLFSGWSSHGEFQEKMSAHQQQAIQAMKNGQ